MKQAPSGVLVIDKPSGPTSHDVVLQVRRLTRTKVGHTGTLDPLATGVLPLLLGQATRLMRFFQPADKEYLAEVKLGQSTDTLDREGRIVAESPVPSLTDEECRQVLRRLTGAIVQRAPLFSAVRVRGERLYQAARKGQTRERPLRQVRILDLELLSRKEDRWTLRVHCSAGTYIRSLAEDIGILLECGAHVHTLRRLRSGCFDLARAVAPGRLAENWDKAFHPLEALLPEFPAVEVGSRWANQIQHGRAIPHPDRIDAETVRLLFKGRLVAIGERHGDLIHPVLVFPSKTSPRAGNS
ncbi:MAG: tRNA pseudouridine(55) synthase TruB [Acidobacteriota bacterium]